jgi:glycosyltransferase involved in cell wall biosynthesis
VAKIKICIYTGITPSTTFINRLVIGLADSGVSILLHGLNKKGWEEYSNHPNIKVIGYTGKLSKFLLVCKYLTLLMVFRSKDCSTLLVQLRKHVSLSSKFNFLAKAAPIVWYKPDIFHVQWVKWIDYWIWLQQLNIKVIASLRGAQINYEPQSDENLRNMYLDLLPKVDSFHAVSNAIADKASVYGANRSRIQTIYSGLRLEQFVFNPVPKPKQGERLQILSVGRDHWVKGYTYAIDAIKILKAKGFDIEYTIVGGLCDEHLFHITEQVLESTIQLTGAIPFEQVQEHLKQAHLFLLPSLEEGIANVVLEAMASGIPVITSRCGGMEEVVQHGVSGWVVEPRDAPAITNAIEDYLKRSNDNLQQLQQAARFTIEQQFTEQKMVTDMVRLYHQTLQQPS